MHSDTGPANGHDRSRTPASRGAQRLLLSNRAFALTGSHTADRDCERGKSSCGSAGGRKRHEALHTTSCERYANSTHTHRKRRQSLSAYRCSTMPLSPTLPLRMFPSSVSVLSTVLQDRRDLIALCSLYTSPRPSHLPKLEPPLNPTHTLPAQNDC